MNYDKAIEINSKYAATCQNRGDVYTDQGKDDLAYYSYIEAFTLNLKDLEDSFKLFENQEIGQEMRKRRSNSMNEIFTKVSSFESKSFRSNKTPNFDIPYRKKIDITKKSQTKKRHKNRQQLGNQ